MRKLGWFSLGFFAALAICAWLIKAPWGFVPGAVCVLAFGILLLAKRGWSVAALAALGCDAKAARGGLADIGQRAKLYGVEKLAGELREMKGRNQG